MYEPLIQALAKIYGEDAAALKAALVTVNDEDQSEALAEGASDFLIQKDAERVRKLRETDAKPDDAKAKSFELKGRKEALEKLENDLKAEFGYEGTEKGLSLVRAIVANKANSTLTDDQVKLHPLFIRREQELTQRADETKAEFEKRLSEVESKFTRDQLIKEVEENALTELERARIIWHANPDKAPAARQDFIERLRGMDWEKIDGQIYPVRDGKRLEDSHGNVKPLSHFVRDLAEPRFEFQKQEAKGNGGNQNTPGGNGFAGLPKTEEEFNKWYFEASDPQEQIRRKDAWDAAQRNKTN